MIAHTMSTNENRSGRPRQMDTSSWCSPKRSLSVIQAHWRSMQVDFTVHKGAVNVLIGENGAGKSTLMKILAGVEQPTSGRILLDGAPVEFKSTREAAHAGIGIIFQELELFPNLSISENIFIGREITRAASSSIKSRKR